MNTESRDVPRVITLGDEGREKLLSGVKQLAVTVKSTMGPGGSTVIAESIDVIGGELITKDGVSVAKEIYLIDPVEDRGAQVAKQAAAKTDEEAGDGTTTSVVLIEALFESGIKHIDASVNKNLVLTHLRKYSNRAIDKLQSIAAPAGKSEVESVALTSVNNDKFIADMISDLYNHKDEMNVEVTESSRPETYSEKIDGFRLSRGYVRSEFINKLSNKTREMKNVRVLVCDITIDSIQNFMNIVQHFAKDPKSPAVLPSLLMVAETSTDFTATALMNYTKGVMDICIVPPPPPGYRRSEIMNDLAIATGATYFSQSNGDNLDLISIDDLGYSDSVVVKKSETIILKNEESKPLVNERIKELEIRLNEEDNEHKKPFLRERIASLKGSIGVIFSGGQTPTEKKEQWDRIVDGINAVRSAKKDGVLPGGGVALFALASNYLSWAGPIQTKEEQVAFKILSDSLMVPLNTIINNAGLEFEDVYGSMESKMVSQGLSEEFDETILERGFGRDLVTGEFGNMIKMGVMDPATVTKSALRNSVSVAISLLSTNVIITLARQ